MKKKKLINHKIKKINQSTGKKLEKKVFKHFLIKHPNQSIHKISFYKYTSNKKHANHLTSLEKKLFQELGLVGTRQKRILIRRNGLDLERWRGKGKGGSF